jgi:ABC-type multidrug transport system fused ATPase/permease subunit
MRLIAYLKEYKLLLSLNIISNLLTALFTALSIPLLVPFLEILFGREQPVLSPPTEIFSIKGVTAYAQYFLSTAIEKNGKEYGLAIVCTAIMIVFFFKNLFRYLSLFFMAPIRNGIIRDLRKQLFKKMLALPLAYFSDEKKGDLMSRITSDVQEVEWSILNVFESIFREPLVIAGALGFMVYVSPELTLFVFGLLLVSGILIGAIGKSLKHSSSRVQEYLGGLVALVEESLSGLRIIKGFNATDHIEKKFSRENDRYKHLLTRILWKRDLSSPLSEFMGISTIAILLWYGSKQVFSSELAAETFLTFIFAFYNVIEPSKSFSKSYYNIQKGRGALERIQAVLNTDERIEEQKQPLKIESFRDKIVFRNVHFSYKSESDSVLKHINIEIGIGQTIALVGSSGAGKSTLVDLLMRFYDVDSGEILIDNHNIKSLRLHELRNLFGIVSQESILFNDTIFNNIALGIENVDPLLVIEAAKAANAHEFIMNTELGYQTNIGDRGNKLSGGQKQRITIARALVRNPPILILDEATSSLDSESEKLVQEALVRLMTNRTSIVIAHRLSTIQHADKIIVLHQGKVVEEGNHEALLKKRNIYSKLFELQGFK